MSDVNMHIGRPAAWIEVEGEDSFTFLQGQFTNDLKSPASSPVTYGLWLDRKGKVLADSFVLQDGEERFFLYSYHTPAETIIARLEPYVIADDVTLRDLTPAATTVALWGSEIDDVITRSGFERPDQGSFFRRDRLFLLRGRRSRGLNVDFVITGDDNEQTAAALSAAVVEAGGQLADEAALERERIQSGIPSVPADIGPGELPQEGRLEQQAISFNKGCYLGQEVMARLRAMGKVRRTLVQVRLDDQNVSPGASLYHGDREIGTVRSRTADAPLLGMALVRIDALEKTQEFALAPDGSASVSVSTPASEYTQ